MLKIIQFLAMKVVPTSASEKLTACHRQDVNNSTLLCISVIINPVSKALSLHYLSEHGCLIQDCELCWVPRNQKLLTLSLIPCKNPS